MVASLNVPTERQQSGKASIINDIPRHQMWVRMVAKWFEPQLDNPATRFREQTIRVLSFIMVVVAGLLALLSAGTSQGAALLPVMAIISVFGMMSSMLAIHLKHLALASWLLVLTLLVDAFTFLWLAGYSARVSFPLFMIVFLFSTLVLPRQYLGLLLVGTLAVLTPILSLQAEHMGDPLLAVLVDAVAVLTIETLGLYVFRLEFDYRLEEAERARVHAEESDRLKTQFLSSVSHELRTPLNAIIGYTELVMSDLFTSEEAVEKQAEFNPKILNNARNLRIMVDDLLDLARIEAGMASLDSTPVVPSEIIREIVDNQQGLLHGKALTLSLQVEPNVPESALWDAFKVNQILTNLIGNAIKFTNSGAVTVRMSAPDEQWLLIAVSDTGIGMQPGAEKYIFDRFRQVDASDQRVHGGTGLGLAITKGLLELMNGTIVVESTLGKGTTFTVTLPRWVKSETSSLNPSE